MSILEQEPRSQDIIETIRPIASSSENDSDEDVKDTNKKLVIIIGQMGTGKTTKLMEYLKTTKKIIKPNNDRVKRVLSDKDTSLSPNANTLIIDDMISIEENRFGTIEDMLKTCEYNQVVVGTIPHYANSPSITLKFMQDRLERIYKAYSPEMGEVHALWYTEETNKETHTKVNIPVALDYLNMYVTYAVPTPGDIDRLNIGERHCRVLKYKTDETFSTCLTESISIVHEPNIDKAVANLPVIKVDKGEEGRYTVVSKKQLEDYLTLRRSFK